MKKKLLLLTGCLLPGIGVYAQLAVSSLITDAKNRRTPGVNVIMKDTRIGTTTAANGTFTLTNIHGSEAVLIFSFVGYLTREVR